jgi:hypothetical protein
MVGAEVVVAVAPEDEVALEDEIAAGRDVEVEVEVVVERGQTAVVLVPDLVLLLAQLLKLQSQNQLQELQLPSCQLFALTLAMLAKVCTVKEYDWSFLRTQLVFPKLLLAFGGQL